MVFEKIKRILCEYFEREEDEITLDTSLFIDLDFDELDYWDLVMDIEEGFETEFTAEFDYSKVTVGDIVRFLEENI